MGRYYPQKISARFVLGNSCCRSPQSPYVGDRPTKAIWNHTYIDFDENRCNEDELYTYVVSYRGGRGVKSIFRVNKRVYPYSERR